MGVWVVNKCALFPACYGSLSPSILGDALTHREEMRFLPHLHGPFLICVKPFAT